jgi:hypothetical protein
MSSDVTYSDDEFSRLVALHCPRWEARSTDIVRALLVNSKTVATVANDFGIKPQHARELRKRFLERVTIRKLPAEQFMQNVKPAALPGLEPFKVEIGKLARHGYAFEQIADFLRANDVQFTDDELKDFLKGNQQ